MRKISCSSPKLIANDLKIDKAFGSMYQTVMMKIKNSVRKDWIVDIVVEHGIKIFEC